MKLSKRLQSGFRSARRYQGGWVAFIYFVISLIISIVLAPKPATPRAAMLEDFDLPVAEEDRPIPVLFGTKRITGGNICWYGDLDTQQIRESSLFSSTVVGYKYFLGIHMVFCMGPVDRFTQIDAGDKEAWTGNVTANGHENVYTSEIFGGDQREGGLYGTIDFMFGESNQTQNTYLGSRITGPMPAFRGVAGLVFRGANSGVGPPSASKKYGGGGKGGYVGTTPYVKPWAVTITRLTKGWQGGTPWYPAKLAAGNGMNPAHIVYECITNTEWGQGSPATLIDEDNFMEFADRCYDEDLGLNMLWNQSSTIEQFLQVVLDHCAGILGYDPQTGKYVVKLIRGDYDVASLRTFDPSNALEVTNFQRRSWGETVNELTISYTDPDTNKGTAIIVQDLGNIRSQEVRIPDKIDRSGISDHNVIKVVAGRELASRSTPLARMDMAVNRIAWDYGPGDVVKCRWPAYDLLLTVFRVLTIRKGNLERGTIVVNLVEDIYALSGIEYTSTQAPGAVITPPLPPPDPPNNGGRLTNSGLTAPPVSNLVDGDRFLVGSPATGIWTGHEGQIAEWDENNEEWHFVDVPNGTILYDEDSGKHVVVNYGATSDRPFGSGEIPINTYSGSSHTLVAADAGCCVEMTNASANGVVIPTHAHVPFKNGTAILVRTMGAGLTTISAESGVTIRYPRGLTIFSVYAAVSLHKRGSSEWCVEGSS